MDDTVRQYVESQRLRSSVASGERAAARESARTWAGMDLDLASLLRLVWRSKWLLLACLLVIPSAALFLASKQTPLFTATATIIHEPAGDLKLGQFEEMFAEQEANESVLGTQIEVLYSQAVAQAVIERLALKDHPAFNPALMEPSLTDRLNGMVGDAIGRVIELFEAPAPESLAGGEEGGGPDREQIMLLNAFAGGLAVNWVRGTFVIQVSFTSPDPILAADVVNAVVDAHVTSQLEAKYQAFTRISSWIDERVGELQANVLEAERAVERFRQESGLTEGVTSTLLTEQISRLNGALAEAQAASAASQSVLDQVRGAANVTEALQALPEVYSTDLISNLRVQQAQLRRDEAELASTLAAQHPALIEVRSKLGQIDRVIVEETDRIRRGLETQATTDRIRMSELQRELDTLRQQIAASSGAGADLGSLERDAAAQRNLLETMLRVSQETAGQYSLARAEARPLSRASVPLWRSSPNLKSVLAISLVLAMLAGLALIVLRELLNTTLRGTDEVEERLGIRCIATVPKVPRREGLDRLCGYVWRKPFSKFAETIRQVRAHLLLDGRQLSTVVVTSALPREGKTTTAVSLARAAAMSGERVILLDCDVRRGAVGKALGCDEAIGLTQLLRGEYTANEVVRTDEATGLHVIPAGDFAANSSRLFYSKEMVSLIESLRLQYDLVVMDTPPLFAVSDAPLLAAIADAVLLCIKWRGTSRRLAEHAVRTLREAGANPVGVVLTQVDLRAYRSTGYSDSPVHARRNDGYYYG